MVNSELKCGRTGRFPSLRRVHALVNKFISELHFSLGPERLVVIMSRFRISSHDYSRHEDEEENTGERVTNGKNRKAPRVLLTE